MKRGVRRFAVAFTLIAGSAFASDATIVFSPQVAAPRAPVTAKISGLAKNPTVTVKRSPATRSRSTQSRKARSAGRHVCTPPRQIFRRPDSRALHRHCRGAQYDRRLLHRRSDDEGSRCVFGAGVTNAVVDRTVTDMQAKVTKRYSNAQGRPFQPILDTPAFFCP